MADELFAEGSWLNHGQKKTNDSQFSELFGDAPYLNHTTNERIFASISLSIVGTELREKPKKHTVIPR